MKEADTNLRLQGTFYSSNIHGSMYIFGKLVIDNVEASNSNCFDAVLKIQYMGPYKKGEIITHYVKIYDKEIVGEDVFLTNESSTFQECYGKYKFHNDEGSYCLEKETQCNELITNAVPTDPTDPPVSTSRSYCVLV